MLLASTLPAAILETILARLALLFLIGAKGDEAAARHAAAEMLASYQPQTTAELRLAANAISFSFHALEALSQAAHPDMSLNKILRLRGSAVSLSRESFKAERRLDQVQQGRRAGALEPQTPEPPTPPRVEKAIALVESTRRTIEAKPTTPIWPQPQNPKHNHVAHAAMLAAAPGAPTLHPRTDFSYRGTATGSASPAA
jgi:hypothetical protein